MHERLSIGSLLEFAWVAVKRNFSFFIGFTVILFLIFAILFSMEFKYNGGGVEIQLALLLLGTIVEAWITLGGIRITLAFCDGRLPQITELFAEWPRLAPYILATIVIKLITYLYIAVVGSLLFAAAGIALPSLAELMSQDFNWKDLFLKMSPPVQLAGLAALVIPLVYLHVKVYFFSYFIVDQGAAPLEAIGRSWDATRGAALKLIVLFAVLVVLNAIGIMALIVGLTVTLPMSLLALAAAYRTLAARQIAQDGEDEAAGE